MDEFAINGKYADDGESYIFRCVSIDGEEVVFEHQGEEYVTELVDEDGEQYAVMDIDASCKFGGAANARRCILANKEVGF